MVGKFNHASLQTLTPSVVGSKQSSCRLRWTDMSHKSWGCPIHAGTLLLIAKTCIQFFTWSSYSLSTLPKDLHTCSDWPQILVQPFKLVLLVRLSGKIEVECTIFLDSLFIFHNKILVMWLLCFPAYCKIQYNLTVL